MKKTRLKWLSETELKYFCLQYNDKLSYIKQHPNGDKAFEYMQDINCIETALHIVTDAGTYEPLKKHVTNSRMPYERLGNVPMGRRQFYSLRRRFFDLLAWIK